MPHDLHFPILRELGLSDAEAICYELLVERGPATGAALTKTSGIGRGNVYNALASLTQRGLVIEAPGAKTMYHPADPERLRALVEDRRRAADALVRSLDGVLPGLASSFRLFAKQPTVRVFEGVEGLQKIYRMTLDTGQPIYAFVGPDAPDPKLYRWLTTTYVRERVTRGIHVHVVASGKGEHMEAYRSRSTAELRELVLLDPDRFPFAGEVDVFGTTTALIGYRSEDLIGITIESAALATTLRSAVQAIFAAEGRASEAGT